MAGPGVQMACYEEDTEAGRKGGKEEEWRKIRKRRRIGGKEEDWRVRKRRKKGGKKGRSGGK